VPGDQYNIFYHQDSDNTKEANSIKVITRKFNFIRGVNNEYLTKFEDSLGAFQQSMETLKIYFVVKESHEWCGNRFH